MGAAGAPDPHWLAFSPGLIQRYYGKSLPFGAESLKGQNAGLLSVEQALADYAVLIAWLKEQHQAQNSPVVAFGGR